MTNKLLKTYRHISLLLLVTVSLNSLSQSFDPPAGQEGSMAIRMDSPLFKAWATECKLKRGPGIITFPDSVEVTFGEAVNATGKAGEGKVVSLGDGGQAMLYFETPICDGPGPDFAVFENSFNDQFLELAFVEVSSDSITFMRFMAVSLTPVDTQIGTYGMLDATNLFNLAGKYRGGYGTPFDLAELKDQPGLDINHIVCVKVVDVIGTLIDSLASRDSRGVIINDPWPTPFESGGFDLDAVGIINSEAHLSDGEWTLSDMVIHPNPFKSFLWINIPGSYDNIVMVYNIQGQLIRYEKVTTTRITLDMEYLNQGLYHLVIINEKGKRYTRIIQKI